MALVNCRECGKEVSPSAKACPHCGADHPYAVDYWGRIISGAIMGCGMLYLFWLVCTSVGGYSSGQAQTSAPSAVELGSGQSSPPPDPAVGGSASTGISEADVLLCLAKNNFQWAVLAYSHDQARYDDMGDSEYHKLRCKTRDLRRRFPRLAQTTQADDYVSQLQSRFGAPKHCDDPDPERAADKALERCERNGGDVLAMIQQLQEEWTDRSTAPFR